VQCWRDIKLKLKVGVEHSALALIGTPSLLYMQAVEQRTV